MCLRRCAVLTACVGWLPTEVLQMVLVLDDDEEDEEDEVAGQDKARASRRLRD